MAPNLRRNLTLLLVAGWATTVLAATAADIKKFPPIAGEIFGQAAAGVRSITVNGKPVTFDGAQNFRANVKLRAGEKYLTLRINYEGLRIIKKYLILRKSAVTKFKVFVPKEKLEKELRAIKPSAAELLRQKRAKLLAAREKAEAARLFAEEERLKTEAKWVKQVSSPRFFANEFGSTSPEGLAQAIARDIQFMGKAKGSSLDRLNSLLALPDLYERLQRSGKKAKLSAQIERLINETAAFRGQPFASLSVYQQKKIMLLNRLLIERLYAAAPVRPSWLAAKGAPAGPKTVEYLYVWEFSDGKLLVVKENKGEYSAEINLPVSKEWLDLKGLSEAELQEIIKKPPVQPKRKWNIIKPWTTKQ
ncbi:MAG: hypothetical protein MUC35_07630 [Candidatus Margulisbacteria bacterium]|jgi:hypothetical protein|nr:hypothetical protein [Candidatus Margulisiibacteriota bacterium]